MNEKEPTHIVLDENNNNMIISPNLTVIFEFLIEIEKEIKGRLNLEDNFKEIHKKYLELLNCAAFLAKKLEDNKIEFSYEIPKESLDISENIKVPQFIRSQSIALFALLETLFCLKNAYQYKTHNKGELIKKAMDNKITQEFIDKYILSEANEFYKTHKDRFSKVSASQLRDLRNCLTHFFSVSPTISLIQSQLNEKARKLEEKHNIFIFVTPEDLYELVSGAMKLIARERSNDCINNKDDFETRILFVQSIVKSSGAVTVKDDQINI